MKKKFLNFGFFWIIQALIGGFLYGIAAFFTKESLEKLKSKCKNYFR